jgi:Zn-finger nucleic acid-binding protein
LHGCGACGGIWLDNSSARRALETFDRKVSELSTRASSHATSQPAVDTRVSCPLCGKPMPRVRVAKTTIDLDTCNAHGTWFDRGELAAVLDALRPRPTPPDRPLIALPVDVPLDPREIPNFRAGTLTPGVAEAGLVAGGAFAVLAALATLAGGSKN